MSMDDKVFHVITTLRNILLVKRALLAAQPQSSAEGISLGRTFIRLYGKQLKSLAANAGEPAMTISKQVSDSQESQNSKPVIRLNDGRTAKRYP